MTPDERQLLAGLFDRIRSAGGAQRDAQAESFINDAVRATPYAPYVLTQTVLIQQQAIEAAAHRIAELEAAAQESAEHQQQGQGSFLGGLSSLFGGGSSQGAQQRPDPSAYRGPVPPQALPPRGYAPPPPPPQPDPYQGQPPQRGPWGAPSAPAGGGFLQNAMSTATGVAGGVVLGNLIGGLFGGHGGGGGLFGAGPAMAQPTETINNYYESSPGGDQGIDPGVPDDSGFIDDSSFDDSSGGGFDDV
jgi:hypothetical protein